MLVRSDSPCKAWWHFGMGGVLRLGNLPLPVALWQDLLPALHIERQISLIPIVEGFGQAHPDQLEQEVPAFVSIFTLVPHGGLILSPNCQECDLAPALAESAVM